MKQTFFAAVFAVLVAVVFLTFRYNESVKAQAQTVAATPAAMMGHAGACPTAANCAQCPYAHTASMQGGQCPYAAACANGATCPHSGSAMSSMSMSGMAPKIVPVVAKTTAMKSGRDCPPCPACPMGMGSGHHAMAGK